MRSGVLGGAFDPPHLGHLQLARRSRAALKLDRVFFVLSYRPPHKRAEELSAFEVRWRMLTAALAPHPAFVPLTLEKDRGGISYTVDTLEELRRIYQEDEFWLLMGGDSLRDLPEWKDPERLPHLARIAVYPREGASLEVPPFLQGRVEIVAGPLLEVSSSQVRALARAGESVDHLVPAAVASVIAELGLYRAARG